MITVSIVSFNTSVLLEKNLKTLFSQTGIKKIEVWVVDNNSSDDSVEMIKKKFPAVKLIESKKNLGFAKGQNLALRQINSDLILILNPDTEFNSEALSGTLKFMEENPDYGISSCKILDKSGKLVSNGGDLPFGISLFSWLFNFDYLGLPSFHRSDEKFYESKSIGWVGGTYMVVRKKLLEKIGYFDENFFMYFEDVDLCYRAKKQGYKIAFNPDLEVLHIGGASSKNPRYNQWRGELRGLIAFSFKNSGALYGIFVSSLVYLAVIMRIVAYAVLGKLNYSGIYLKVISHL